MDKKIIKFDDTEIKEYKFQNKSPTLDFFYKQLRILSRPKLVLELLNWLLKLFLCNPEVRLKKVKK